MESHTLLIILKIAVMILFFLIVTFVGSLPIRSKEIKRNRVFMSLGSTFAGALFLNVALLHILPQSADTIEQYLKSFVKQNSNANDDDIQVFPLAYLLVLVGFLITIFFTKVIVGHTHADDHQPKHHHHHHHQQHHQHKQSIISDSSLQKPILEKQSIQNMPNGIQNTQKNQQSSSDSDNTEQSEEEARGSIMSQAYLLTLAIYFHTIFEGIAVGVQNNLADFLSTAVAIAFHKWADALSMGIHYRTKQLPKKIALGLIFGQAVLNVISIGLGWIIAAQGVFVQALFLSLSAGTFLAISTMQLLSESFHHRQFIKRKYLIMVFGTIFVSSIWFVENSIFQNTQDS